MLKNAILLFAFAFAILLMFLPTFTRMQDLKQKDLEYQAKINGLQQENVRLKEERRLLEEDPVYLEKVAREKMGLIKKGEVVYQLVPAESEQ
jgi:cell division protein FtsB